MILLFKDTVGGMVYSNLRCLVAQLVDLAVYISMQGDSNCRICQKNPYEKSGGLYYVSRLISSSVEKVHA